ncbi:MAG: STAS-like domain-containing protein [Planctomycetes bacterium]|nr:STAS-like domain-containing protein [Planctomycetota bacterium]
MSPSLIRSIDYCNPDDRIVDSAQRVAAAVIAACGTTDVVTVSMDGVLGASSSFFNVLLSDVVASLGPEAIGTRVRLTGLTRTQQAVFERSRQAVLRSAS